VRKTIIIFFIFDEETRFKNKDKYFKVLIPNILKLMIEKKNLNNLTTFL
jgi:hypothetical protein